MSLYRYFTLYSKPYLPNLKEEKTKFDASETKAVNQEVEKTLNATPSGGRQRKRKTTMCCILSGELLLPQVIYTGKTSQCHPNVSFPAGRHIWHSKYHWSN